MRRTAWRLSAALGASAASVGCGAPPPRAESAVTLRDVFQTLSLTGADGMRLEVVDLAEGTALIRVLGVENELTGKVLEYERKNDGARLSYVTKWHGRSLYTLVRERDGRFRAYLPGVRDGLALTHSSEQSAAIDAQAIQRLHAAQKTRGELDALQRFDRAAEEAQAEAALTAESARTTAPCGKPLPVAVTWSTVSDAQILEYSVAGYCEGVLSAIGRVCEAEAGKRFVKQNLSAIRCSLDGQNHLVLEGGALHFDVNFELTNASELAYDALLAMKPAGASRTLGAQLIDDQTAVCSDAEQKRVVLVGPREGPHGGLAYGDGKRFYLVRVPPLLGSGWFFSPRQRNDSHNDDFRGLDLRVFSYIEPDPAHSTCKLACGTRESQLTLLSGPPKDAILAGATYEPSPHQREPYALARDRTGTYYFVDRGATEETARDFRLYRGKRGQLKQLAMKDVVSDSEGEIFASPSGSLRLIVGKQSAQWVAGATSNLLLLPLGENMGLIYNELGVYLSERLGIPCDDF